MSNLGIWLEIQIKVCVRHRPLSKVKLRLLSKTRITALTGFSLWCGNENSFIWENNDKTCHPFYLHTQNRYDWTTLNHGRENHPKNKRDGAASSKKIQQKKQNYSRWETVVKSMSLYTAPPPVNEEDSSGVFAEMHRCILAAAFFWCLVNIRMSLTYQAMLLGNNYCVKFIVTDVIVTVLCFIGLCEFGEKPSQEWNFWMKCMIATMQ